jgi:hypothetical protein
MSQKFGNDEQTPFVDSALALSAMPPMSSLPVIGFFDEAGAAEGGECRTPFQC